MAVGPGEAGGKKLPWAGVLGLTALASLFRGQRVKTGIGEGFVAGDDWA